MTAIVLIPYVALAIPSAFLAYRETSSILFALLGGIFWGIYNIYFAIRYGIFQPQYLNMRRRT